MSVKTEIAQRIAWVFPGQGSQYVGMGQRVYNVSEAARKIFHQADEVLGYSITSLCFNGPADELDDTVHAQPAIFTVSVAYLALLDERPAATAGSDAAEAAWHRVDTLEPADLAFDHAEILADACAATSRR